MNETEYMATTTLEEAKPLTQVIYSNVEAVVRQGRSIFESLWENAIPAEDRIREIEEGIEPERTQVMYGSHQILRWTIGFLSKAKESYDTCVESDIPSVLFKNTDLMQEFGKLKERGIKSRFLTEITSDNLSYCKQIAKTVEVRHLDGIRGTFSIADKRQYAASGAAHQDEIPSRVIVSTVKAFVEHQQYSFDVLWEKAMSAELKIRQIEEGFEPEYIKTIDDSAEVEHILYQLLDAARQEVRVIFSTANAIRRLKRAGGLQYLIAVAKKHKLRIRFLAPLNKEIQSEYEEFVRELLPSPSHNRDQDGNKIVDIRYVESSWKNTISLLIIDEKFSLAAELKDDTKETIRAAVGLATLSNSKATVASYISMFENMWRQSELHERLKAHSKMQYEFINIAAHELRTPIQPIIGLADVLYANSTDDHQRNLVTIINRNARRLKILAENILDVTKLESRSLNLQKEPFDLKELVEETIEDIKNTHEYKNSKVQLLCKFGRYLDMDRNTIRGRRSSCDEDGDRVMVEADKEKIIQVIHNLVNNALMFTNEEGIISVEVAIARLNNVSAGDVSNANDDISRDKYSGYDDDLVATVSVKDTGQGIAPEILPIIFEKFVTRSNKGTGLGLFISRGIIEAHGGKIWGENNDDYDERQDRRKGDNEKKGATFTFTLPLIKNETPQKHHNS